MSTKKIDKKNIDELLSKIEKNHGKGSIMRLTDGPVAKIPAVSTGSLSLDLALGIGGIPKGRIVEIFGPESSGKTTLALHCIAEVQKLGGVAAFIDAEHAFDSFYAKNLGIDIENLLISQPDYGEQALDIVNELVKSEYIDLIVIDSVAALVPKSELEGEMGETKIGMQARLMSQALRKLTANINKAKCSCIFINQIREKIGVLFGNPETTPGGNALKFFSSIRIDIRKSNQIKNSDGEQIGCCSKIKIVKNKVAPPFKTVEVEIIYGKGISKISELIDLGIKFSVLKKSGSWISFQEKNLGQGKDSVISFLELEENKQLFLEIEKYTMEFLK